MNDNDNNILIAQQGNCDVALVDGSKILHYKDASGNDQSLDFVDLTDGTNLFKNNKNLNVDWDISLPNLTTGDSMFSSCKSLTSFSGELPELTNGYYMFSGCTGLTSFNAGTEGLKSLSDGLSMFYQCTNLTSFNVPLPNLTTGDSMFAGCKLDKDSVHCIAESIPVKPDGAATTLYRLVLGIDASLQNDADVAADLATIETTKKWILGTQWN